MIPLFSQQYTKTCRTPAHWWTFNTACSLKATSCRLSDPLRGHLSTWQEILPEGAVVKVSKPSQDTPKGNTNRLGRSLLLSNDCAPKGGTPSQTEHPLVDPQKLGTVRKILHAKVPSTRLDLAYKLSTMGTYSLPDAPQVPTVGTYGTVDPNFVRGIEGPDCRDGAMNP